MSSIRAAIVLMSLFVGVLLIGLAGLMIGSAIQQFFMRFAA